MYNFTFHVPTTIHFGKGQISHLAELASYGSRALLCYGGGSIKRNGIYDQALSILKDAGVQVFELAGVEPNPRIQTVRRGVELCHQNDIQMVLAIGGGSTIDCAKVVAAGAKYDGDAWDLVIKPELINRFGDGWRRGHFRPDQEREVGHRRRVPQAHHVRARPHVHVLRPGAPDRCRHRRHDEPHLRELLQHG